MNKEQMIDIIEALDAGDPVEMKWDDRWVQTLDKKPNFRSNKYRRKPAPLERWDNIYDTGFTSFSYPTEGDAREAASSCSPIRTAVHMREVIENE